MLARDYFESLLTLESDLKRAKDRLELAENKLDGLGHSGTSSIASRSVDPDKFTNRICAVDKAREQLKENYDYLVEREAEAMDIIDHVGDPALRCTGLWRECLELRYLRNMTIREVGSRVDVSNSTVHNAISNAFSWIDSSELLVHL